MFLGIDLGTTELKALLLDDDGQTVGMARHPLQISRPRQRWSEQNPEDWWLATKIALSALRNSHRQAFAGIQAIGLSGQMHGAVLLDANNHPLRSAILWNDMRSAVECAELELRAPRLREISGNCAMPGLTAPKLLWVARHEPSNFSRLSCVLLPKDYLRLRLTNMRVTDASDASGTLWLDVARRKWSDELLHACNMTRHQVPPIVEGCTATGVVCPSVASELFWVQLLADALGISLRRPRDTQSIAALGAARLGWLAADGDLSVVARPPLLVQEFSPDAVRHSRLLERCESYRLIYMQLRPLFVK